jgi:hypothetical protein
MVLAARAVILNEAMRYPNPVTGEARGR